MKYSKLLRLSNLTLCLFLGCYMIGFSQLLAVGTSYRGTQQNTATKSLRAALLDLEHTYRVSILFNSEMRDVYVPYQEGKTFSNLEDALQSLFRDTELTYKKVRDNFYVIVLKENPASQSRELDQAYIPKGIQPLASSAMTLNYSLPLGNHPIERTITGKVTSSENNEAIPGVTVLVKGTTNGTVTDAAGGYQISVPDNGGTLVFSFVGYTTEEVAITSQTVVNVTLLPDIKALGEVVVVGYGTQQRDKLVGSVASIKAEDLRTQGVNTVQKSLQGRLAGVNIESSGGNPGSGVRILVRGTGSFFNNDPLYIVDGVQVTNISNLAPSDIASIDVLKDASAAAIYGSRAANGVVLVTTKSGKQGPPQITINAYGGMQNIIKKMDVLNASEWATVSNMAHDNAGLPRLDVAQNPESLGAGTDWQGAIYRAAPVQSYEVGVGGGSENFTYNLSGGYFDQQGIVKKTDYNRVNLRMKSDFTKGRLKIGETVILTHEYWRNMAGGWGGQGGNPVGSAPKMIPVFDIYDPAAIGGFSGVSGPVVNVANPVAQLYLEDPKVYATNIIANLYGELKILDNLKYKYNIGYTGNFGYNYTYTAPYVVGGLFTNPNSDLTESRNQTTFVLQEHTLSYDKAFGKHNLQALLGFAFQKNQYRGLTGSKSGMPDGIEVLDAGTGNIAAGGNAYENSLESYFGRLVYSYDNRYLVTINFRRDGSSRFSPAYRYGNFPSVAVGWNISNEGFFDPVRTVVSTFKIRGSYGVLGNQEIPNYSYIRTIDLNLNYVTGQNQTLWPGSIQRSLVDPNIKWEESRTVNVGADFGFLEDKVSLTADYFVRKNTDLLLRVPLPLSMGSGSNPVVNAGQVTNKGIELALSYRNKVGELSYQVTGTFTSIKSIVDKLGTGTQEISGGQPTHHGSATTLSKAGEPIGSFYLIKTDGIFNSQAEIDAYSKDGQPIQPTAKPGDIRFVDANNDGIISDDDRVNAGSPNPKFSYGFGGNASWKGFDLSVFFQGTYGNKIYNGLRQDLEGMNLEWNYAKTTLNAWTPENHTDFPRAVINDPNLNSRVSDRFLESGSYMRLRTLQVGYTIPKALTDRIKLNSCRIYIGFDNLFTITKYKGYNPDLGRYSSSNENQGIFDRGVDYGHVAYPIARTSMLGLQISL
ncbi:TonB-dependent receptor [Cytophagaceae bacterium YF14B1]|uniref:TonB-dependent receptor n=1 Tax=Xanthocytophaga flava TaxID=3048013 RepID=A0AAE3QX58_9BACT|nr:TonB-dependent receptor [Xanthocytophaga flavus]MDJ1485165.1 TonB-dependent receptor [Xanthocytophaga flavus]